MNQPTQTLHQQLQQHERNIIAGAVSNQQRLFQAAGALGIKYCTLWRKMKKYGIFSDV